MCRARAAVAPHARGAVGPRSTGGRTSFHRSQLKLEFEGERARRLQEREAHILPVLNLLFDGCSKVKVWLVWRRQDGFGMPSWARIGSLPRLIHEPMMVPPTDEECGAS